MMGEMRSEKLDNPDADIGSRVIHLSNGRQVINIVVYIYSRFVNNYFFLLYTGCSV